MSERQACHTIQFSRCVYRYQAKRTTDEPIVQELRQLAEKQPRWGCEKMSDYLRNEGHAGTTSGSAECTEPWRCT